MSLTAEAPPAPPPRVEATEDDWATAQREWEKELHKYDYRLRDVVEELCGHVVFSVQKTLVGHVKSSEKVVGVRYGAMLSNITPTLDNRCVLSFLL